MFRTRNAVNEIALPLLTDYVQTKLGIEFSQMTRVTNLNDYKSIAPESLINNNLLQLINDDLKLGYY